MSQFDDAVGALDSSVDRVFSELFAHQPRDYASVNRPAVDDPSRAGGTFAAVFIHAGGRQSTATGEFVGTKAERGGHVTARDCISVMEGAFSGRPRRGDLITRLKTAERFEIAEILPLGIGRLRIDLIVRS